MIARKLILSVAAAGVLSTGLGGVALAAPTAAATPKAPAAVATAKHHEDKCKDVAARVEKLEKRRVALEARIDKVQKAHDRAVDKHHDERAKKLEGRLDKLHKAHDRVVDRIAKLHARCDAK